MFFRVSVCVKLGRCEEFWYFCVVCFFKHTVCKGPNGDFFLPIIQYFCPNWNRLASQMNKSLFTQLFTRCECPLSFFQTQKEPLSIAGGSTKPHLLNLADAQKRSDESGQVWEQILPTWPRLSLWLESGHNISTTAVETGFSETGRCQTLTNEKEKSIKVARYHRTIDRCLFCFLVCTVWRLLSLLFIFSPCDDSRAKKHILNLENYSGKVLDKHLKDGNTRVQIPFQCGFLILTFFLFWMCAVLIWFVFFFFTSTNPLSFMKSLTFLMPPTLSD